MRHQLTPELRARMHTGPDGLTSDEAAGRLRELGSNDILGETPGGLGSQLRETARDPMIWFLVGAALLFAVLGDAVEATVLALALLPIAGMDLYLHRRTEASREALAGRLATRVLVMRNGRRDEIEAAALVPGDLVFVAESQSFPADGVLIKAERALVDESALTGESLPARKEGLDVASLSPMVAHEHWAAAGTRLLTGDVVMLVAYTGADTLYGGVVRSARAGQRERTPLQRAVAGFVAILLGAALVLCLGLALTRLAQGHGWLDALLSAVTLAVAALPEEFPVALAFFLGVGVYRLARRQALVRRAVAVENIGRVTCICSDKTGTLTEGRLRLEHLLPTPGHTEDDVLAAAAMASRLGSNDPMDEAILARAGALDWTVVSTFPFTEERRSEATVWRSEADTMGAAVKGAPETVLPLCDADAATQQAWLEKAAELAGTGHKVIASGRQTLTGWDGVEPRAGYSFVGLLGFEDPLREGVTDAVATARGAGIHVIMVTGDHPGAARAIALTIGLGDGTPEVIEGDELEQYLSGARSFHPRSLDVVARCMPLQKLALVIELRRRGEIVAVTGDGVNDAPALKGADVGIAMGERGTRAARESADVVLLDDNFRTIVAAIAEGRQLFANLRRCFAYLLVVHIPLVLTAALIPFAGYPLVYLPVHIVWLELVIHPTALLAFQEPAVGMDLAPARHHSGVRFFDTTAWVAILAIGATGAVAAGVVFLWGLDASSDSNVARSAAILVLLSVSAGTALGLGGARNRSPWIVALLTLASFVPLVAWPAIAPALHLAIPPYWSMAVAAATAVVAFLAGSAIRSHLLKLA